MSDILKPGPISKLFTLNLNKAYLTNHHAIKFYLKSAAGMRYRLSIGEYLSFTTCFCAAEKLFTFKTEFF